MRSIYIQPIVDAALRTIQSHEIPGTPGAYRRWLWQNPQGTRELGVNEYGCADAMNILYTVGEFDCPSELRTARLVALLDMQDPETGLFNEATHHTFHTTAHCAAAIELFDATPRYPLTALHKYRERGELYALLESVDWKAKPWQQSHLGAGVYAALVNAKESTAEFEDAYFGWFRENTDPVTGFWRKGYADRAPLTRQHTVDGQASLYQYMAGSFHYLFNHEHAKQPLVYPQRVVDSCIDLYTKDGLPTTFATHCDFLEIDWLYCLTRALRQTHHRRDEAMALVEDFAVRYTDALLHTDYNRDEFFNDLHCLFGGMCALAELQNVMPDKILSDKPLRLVLDRRPFI